MCEHLTKANTTTRSLAREGFDLCLPRVNGTRQERKPKRGRELDRQQKQPSTALLAIGQIKEVSHSIHVPVPRHMSITRGKMLTGASGTWRAKNKFLDYRLRKFRTSSEEGRSLAQGGQ